MINPYLRIIDLLLDDTVDFRAIVAEVAKKNPEIVLNSLTPLPVWMNEVDDELRDRRKIGAIRVWRANTGLSLKESKEAVEARMDELGL